MGDMGDVSEFGTYEERLSMMQQTKANARGGAKHTPGPWFVSYYGTIASESNPTNPLGIVGRGIAYTSNPTEKANADLVAASPQLLEALRAAVAYVELYTGNGVQEQPPVWAFAANGEDYDPTLIADYARTIIAKAEGR